MRIVPIKCRDYPEAVQRAYVAEFLRVLESGDSAVAAGVHADTLLERYDSFGPKATGHAERSVLLEAHVAELAAFRSIDSIVPAAILDAIRTVDSKPYFALFEIATEGESDGGGQKKIWPFRAIKELADRVREKAGKLWAGHTGAGDPNRKSLGEVIWGFAKRSGTALKAYAVAHVTDPDTAAKIESGEYDCCSIEGVVDFVETDGAWRIESVKSVSGLALANSKTDTPGFRTAGAVAAIQELQERDQNVTDKAGNVIDQLSSVEIRIAIERLRLTPADLFRADDLLAVEAVKKAIEAGKKEAADEKQKEIEALQNELSPLKAKAIEAEIAEQVGQSPLLTDASEAVRAFVKKAVSRVDFGGVDSSARAAKIDEQIKSELDWLKSNKITLADPAGDDTDKAGDDKTAGDGAGKKTDKPAGKPADPDDFTDPRNNPLIPSGDE